ncbi:rhodanese-like domain-containing protein [Lacibacter sp. MH-610]|uniref:rhodanese-like domain-containing protein n=1 Tax=Lacibacter sp. MH-610 TaxID=3020883 RepID=UPI00389124EA
MFGFLKKLFGPGTDFKALMEQGAVIVDVRTAGEYKSGHIRNALNIPVDVISSKIKELKQQGKPVITCCASGMRSARAAAILKQNGIEAYNGGSWVSLGNRLN